MKKRRIELVMACLLLMCFYLLSREAALVSGNMQKEKVVLLDAGHGGIDPGMIGVGGLKEKGINLSITQKVKELLEQQGFKVIMTRDADEGLYDDSARNKKAQDLQKRISLIQETSPLLSVSIHQNSYQDASVYGPQVFYYADSKEGEKLAKVIQEQLNAGLSVERPRKEKGNTTYYLLKKSPGIMNIVECGFLTNPKEAELLQTEEYQQKVAQCIAKGIITYLEDGRK